MKEFTTITRFELGILYRIMMKRIANNLSPAQLSFLIGKPDDFVHSVEMLESGFYSAEDFRCIASAMEEVDTLLFYPVNPDETKVQAEMKKKYFGNACVYTCNIIDPHGKTETYFTLTDDTEFNKLSQELDDEEFSLASDGILLLLQTGYFSDARMAIEPYLAINLFLQRRLKPDAIKEAFKDLSLAEVPLIGMVQMENSRFAYQQR
jgi:hypothetical protein